MVGPLEIVISSGGGGDPGEMGAGSVREGGILRMKKLAKVQCSTIKKAGDNKKWERTTKG